MSEKKKNCPKGENYNKETKRCEPKATSPRATTTRSTTARSTTARATTARATTARATTARATTARATTARATTARATTARATTSRATTARATTARATTARTTTARATTAKSKTPKSKTPKSSLSSSIVDSFILHEGGDSYRLLVNVPVNNPELWPNPNICFFRTSGRSNQGSEIFKGSWFPIAGIKDSSKMPKYLQDNKDGFLIKMVFIMNKKDDFSDALQQPKWISDLVGDYPIILDESEKILFNNKSSITIDEFIEKNKYNETKKSKTIDTRYERLALHIKSMINELFEKFLNYFLYEWQAMLSLRIGGGYWNLNPIFKEYISRKLASFDFVPVPNIDPSLKEIDEKELGKIYDSDPNNNKETNTGQPTIDFSERIGTQLSMAQINEIKNVEELKLKSARAPSVMSFQIYTILQSKYTNKIDSYIRAVENARKPIALFILNKPKI